MKEISDELYKDLLKLGIIDETNTRSYNVGKSNYSESIIQAWTVWLAYNLDPWDADIVKRVLRKKAEEGLTEVESRILDYEKIIHICKEKIRQLNLVDYGIS